MTSSPSSRAKYTCVCKEGFYVPNETTQGFSSDKIEKDAGNFSCVACPGGCSLCDKDGICIFGHEEPEDILTESVLRATMGAVLGICVCCCFVLSLIVFRQRKCKVCSAHQARKYFTEHKICLQTIATGMWTILETILLGIIFLYSTVSPKNFNQSSPHSQP